MPRSLTYESDDSLVSLCRILQADVNYLYDLNRAAPGEDHIDRNIVILKTLRKLRRLNKELTRRYNLEYAVIGTLAVHPLKRY